MKRTLYSELLKWKSSVDRKPLLLQGARQVGKTWLLNEFGENEFDSVAYFNFEESPKLIPLFENDMNPLSLIESLQIMDGEMIDPDKTMIFFDEIQAAPKALTSLKYFHEKATQFHVVAAGSLLGVKVGKSSGFPVGKVNFLDLYPMSFYEYLSAAGEDLLLQKLLSVKYPDKIESPIHELLLKHLRFYFVLGGMPEVVKNYMERKNINEARKIQRDILNAYKRDFSKYSEPSESIRISEVWDSIPAHLSKENKKFKFSEIRKGGRSSRYESAIEWLKNAGLINLSYNIKTPKIPMTGYRDLSKFKVFIFDTGLLSALTEVPVEMVLHGSKLFSEYNGAFTENFVAQELVCSGSRKELFYWTSRSDAEVDFMLQWENGITPVEVKSGISRRLKSLHVYDEKYSPDILFRISPRNFTKDNKFINIPLYAVPSIFSWPFKQK